MERVPVPPSAERWAELSAGWSIPDHVLAAAPERPFGHDPARFALDPTDASTTSAGWAREVLPPVGGTVLDVGCGAGRAALALVPPATEVIGVDRSGAMLDAFVAAAADRGVARRTVHGDWTDVVGTTPPADVVVCHHVLYDVTDIVPFVIALTARARLAVVVEISRIHPMTALTDAWRHFWDLSRPAGPTADLLLDVLRDLGLEPESATSRRPARSTDVRDPVTAAATARRRLCLPVDREPEVAAWLAEHPIAWPDTMVTIRWPGEAEAMEV